ncbi:MAG: hypothetical protein OXG35_17225 [Acidobacteria bacterium]|nr:hypothetical protein [Acidobacteriota bacterium]
MTGFAALNRRFDGIDRRLDGLETDVRAVKARVEQVVAAQPSSSPSMLTEGDRRHRRVGCHPPERGHTSPTRDASRTA